MCDNLEKVYVLSSKENSARCDGCVVGACTHEHAPQSDARRQSCIADSALCCLFCELDYGSQVRSTPIRAPTPLAPAACTCADASLHHCARIDNVCTRTGVQTQTHTRARERMTKSKMRILFGGLRDVLQGTSAYPYLRLLLPGELEPWRGKYGIKELSMAKLYARALGVPTSGDMETRILNYTDGAINK
jgi:DNA ligase N terminus